MTVSTGTLSPDTITYAEDFVPLALTWAIPAPFAAGAVAFLKFGTLEAQSEMGNFATRTTAVNGTCSAFVQGDYMTWWEGP